MIVAWLAADHKLDACRTFLQTLKERLRDIPLYMSDELGHYERVLWEIYRTVGGELPKEPPSPAIRAAEVDPLLDYARIVKTRKHRIVVKVDHDVMYGDPKRIEARLAGSKINTSYVERFNLTLRHYNRNLGRRSLCFSKKMKDFVARVDICVAYYNLVRLHSGISQVAGGRNVAVTPAQAAGLCPNQWTITELLAMRPTALPQGVCVSTKKSTFAA